MTILLLILPLLLVACTTAPSRVSSKQLDRVTAPKVKEYTKDQQQRAAVELTDYCDRPRMLCVFVTDYGKLRDSSRALQGKKVDVTR